MLDRLLDASAGNLKRFLNARVEYTPLGEVISVGSVVRVVREFIAYLGSR